MRYDLMASLLVLCAIIGCSSTSPLTPTQLRTEYADNPMTVDVAAPRLSWQLPSVRLAESQTAYQVRVGTAPDLTDLWDSGKVASGQTLNVPYGGAALSSSSRAYWRVRVWNQSGQASSWSPAAFFESSLLAPADWEPAKWVTSGSKPTEPAPLLRKAFTLSKSVTNARVYVCGLGYYELYLNGHKVGDRLLDPAQTDYETRCLYTTYDITKDLKQGDNAVGMILGTGWFDQHVVWGGMSYGAPCAVAKIVVTHPDRSTTTVVTDGSWKTHPSAIISNNLYAGESYDARREVPGWSATGFDDSAWARVKQIASPTKVLESQKLPPIRVTKSLSPVKVTELKPDLYIYDFGQNFAGIPLLTTNSERNTKYTLRFAEAVHSDGTLDPASTGVFATNVVQTDTYVCKGSGEEIYRPRFTYHGFRYVELTGPKPVSLEALVLHTDVAPTSSFECSDPTLNTIHRMARWTFLSNLHGLPTDCPARERNGWLGDAHATAEMAMLNFDMATFYPKYLRDIESSRRGHLPGDVAPGKRITGPNGNTDWGAAIVMLPYFQYVYYGDTETLREHYPAMEQYIKGVLALNDPSTVPVPKPARGSLAVRRVDANDVIITKGYGDWCPPGEVYPPKELVPLTTTAWFFRTTSCMAKVADVLGKPEEAGKYRALAQRIRNSYNKYFYNPANSTYGSQTGDVVALAWGLAPQEDRQLIADSLFHDVMTTHHAHHTTGILGSRYLHQVLTEYGYPNAALALFHQTTYPSIGHLISLGATTFWENWGEPEIDQKYGARSLNHPMQAALDAYFFQSILGINADPDRPAFKHVILKPKCTKEMTWAKGHVTTPYGVVVSSWRTDPATQLFHWHIEVPPNTTATATLPSGRTVELKPGIHDLTSTP